MAAVQRRVGGVAAGCAAKPVRRCYRLSGGMFDHFVGRLATYRYYNMDQVVAQALTLYARTLQHPSTGQVARQ